MAEALYLPVFLSPIFVKLAPVDRTTIENWQRGGSFRQPGRFDPAETDDRRSSYTLADLLKLELMEKLRKGFGSSPRIASEIADQIISSCDEVFESEFKRLHQSGEERNDKEVAAFGFDGKSLSFDARGPDDLMLVVPVGGLAAILFRKFKAYSAWAELGLPELKQSLLLDGMTT